MANIKKFKRGDKTKLSANFSVKEFECKCNKCEETLINLDHVQRLQQLRDDLGCSITINSAYRCLAHNTAIGGEKNSQHMKGNATDIVVDGMTPDEVADSCEKFDGLGRYNTFTHLDSRGRRARWDLRTKKDLKAPSKKDIKITLKDIEKE
jgi:uncharacterized protein YcbK (DUF882 family)